MYVHINNVCMYCMNVWCVVVCLHVQMHAVCILVVCILVYKCGGDPCFPPSPRTCLNFLILASLIDRRRFGALSPLPFLILGVPNVAVVPTAHRPPMVGFLPRG